MRAVVFRSKLEIMRNGNLCDDWEFVDQIELTKFSFEAKSGMDYKPSFWFFNLDM